MYSEGNLRKVLSRDILEKIKNNEPITYENVSIEGDLILNQSGMKKSGDKFLIASSIKIKNSIINGKLEFRDTDFQDQVRFNNTRFIQDVCFKGARFRKNATFRNTKFDGRVIFRNAWFCKNANFRGGQLKKANFRHTTFIGGINFNGTIFEEDAYFEDSEFYENTYFTGAHFNKGAHFTKTKFYNGADFKGAKFKAHAGFKHSCFKKGAVFKNINFNGGVYFKESMFMGDVDFRDSQFKDGIFWQACFYKKLYLKRTTFSNFYIKWDSLKDQIDYDNAVYLALIKNFRTLDPDDADNCYYQYREEKRKSMKLSKSKCYDFLSWLSFGYGVRPIYPLYFSLILILICGFFFYIFNSTDGIRGNNITFQLIDAISLSAKVFILGEWNGLHGIYSSISMIEIFLKWVISALFVSVLVKKLITNI